MTIKEAQEAVDRWIREYGVRYFSPQGEDNGKTAMGEEMADVLWVLLCLANQTGIDLTEELQKSIEKKTNRDSLRHIHNKKLLA